MISFKDFRYVSEKGEMFKYQGSLPKLPVPPLRQTLERYLHSVRPLLSEEEFDMTQGVVEEFGKGGGQGEELQRKLQQRAETTENWVRSLLSLQWLAFVLLCEERWRTGRLVCVTRAHALCTVQCA